MNLFPVPPLQPSLVSSSDVETVSGATNTLTFKTRDNRTEAAARLQVPMGGSSVDDLAPLFDWSYAVIGGSATGTIRLVLTFFVESPDGRLFRPAIMDASVPPVEVSIGASGTVEVAPSYGRYNEDTHNNDACAFDEMEFHHGYPYVAVKLQRVTGVFSGVTVNSVFTPKGLEPEPPPEPELFWTNLVKTREVVST